MEDCLDGLNLPTKVFGETKAHLLNIPLPPQLIRAVGCSNQAQYLGIWFDNHQVCVSDGYSTTTSSNPGWESYFSFPLIQNYIYALRCFGAVEVDIFGKVERHNVAEHGFLLADGQIYLASVKSLTQILRLNADSRPNWLQDVSEAEALNPQWQDKYQSYLSSRLRPKYNADCLEATAQMLAWLEGNFYHA